MAHAQQPAANAAPMSFPDWPPTLDTASTVTQSIDGRTIEHYEHGPREAWDYPPATNNEWGYHAAGETAADQENHNTFYVVAPKVPRDNAPLCVVLHSANRTGYDYLGYSSLNRKIDGSDTPGAGVTDSPDDFYALYLNSTNDEWWGWSAARANAAKNIPGAPPAERRVLDTIEWVATHYKIDRNRIYLCGVSMGGCGSLGIGMAHGDIFAALRVSVPAGTEYASTSMGGFAPAPAPDAPQGEHDAWIKRCSGVGLPDPPVMVDFSSQIDNWSKTQSALLHAAQIGHLPLVLSWGPFGHTGSTLTIGKYPLCDIALAFPWLEIRKNEAYPVFTHASCDQVAPWLTPPPKFDESGQTNAWFRWKNKEDTASAFTMQLWIAHPEVKNPPPAMPDAATTDVTLRRLQQFKVEAARSYTWQLARDGQTLASGQVTPDLANLLTIPKLPLTTVPAELSIK
jgi:hypothetical protein